MKSQTPEISVVMGVYNQWNREELYRAVQSILRQSFSNFEFIIYDDGSHPDAASYIQELRGVDRRIVLAGREENHGLAFSLNACIRLARGRYIARMDADDVSLPERLQIQYDFMESHPEYAWCGCNTKLFDSEGIWGSRKMPENPREKDYLKYSPYVHPTVMYRREILTENGGYLVAAEMLRCEDYEIFMRLQQKGLQGYNIQEELFCYREDKEAFHRRKMRYRFNEAKLRWRNFGKMGILLPLGWLYVMRPVIGGMLPAGVIAWMKRREAGAERARSEKVPSGRLHAGRFRSGRFCSGKFRSGEGIIPIRTRSRSVKHVAGLSSKGPR